MCFFTSFRVLFRVTNRSRISVSCRAQFRDDPSTSGGMLFIGSWRTSSCWGQRGPDRLGLLETSLRGAGRLAGSDWADDQDLVLLFRTMALSFCAFVLLCCCTFALCFWTLATAPRAEMGWAMSLFGEFAQTPAPAGAVPCLCPPGWLPSDRGRMHRRTFHIPSCICICRRPDQGEGICGVTSLAAGGLG